MAHVLIVVDAPDALDLATATLRSAGHTTSAATTAAEALRGGRARPPEVILMELRLPDADGTELCRELRTLSDAFILMLTPRDDEVDEVLGVKLGADDYVTKPYSPRDLTARIEALLRRRPLPRRARGEPPSQDRPQRGGPHPHRARRRVPHGRAGQRGDRLVPVRSVAFSRARLRPPGPRSAGCR